MTGFTTFRLLHIHSRGNRWRRLPTPHQSRSNAKADALEFRVLLGIPHQFRVTKSFHFLLFPLHLLNLRVRIRCMVWMTPQRRRLVLAKRRSLDSTVGPICSARITVSKVRTILRKLLCGVLHKHMHGERLLLMEARYARRLLLERG